MPGVDPGGRDAVTVGLERTAAGQFVARGEPLRGAAAGTERTEVSQRARESDREATVPGNAGPTRAATVTPLGAPKTVGRYVVLEQLGEGGMGVVVAAFDPVLQRKVALKLVRPASSDPAEAARRRASLRREALALAALSHPNVVAVYDVGEVPTPGEPPSVYIAMELEVGDTLRRWSEQPRPWQEIVDVFVQAGRGLWAAHAQGIVHGDFKPTNVLRRQDGRVVVLDFGLARQQGPASRSREPSASIDLSRSGSLVGDPTFAEPGFVMGTPAYMAPEQFHGEHGPLADQFAFCVAFFRVLYGRHPFASQGSDTAQQTIAERIRKGASVSFPSSRGAVRRVARVLARGLSHEPSKRFEDMDALLRALAAATRPLVARLVVTGVAVAGVGGLWSLASLSPVAAASCDEYPELTQAWGQARREQLRAAAVTLGGGPGERVDQGWVGDAHRVLEGDLDRYAASWLRERRALCEAPLPSDPERRARRRLQRVCLDGALVEVSTLVDVLAAADAQMWARAARPTSDLSRPESCRKVTLGPHGLAGTLNDGGAQIRNLLAMGRANLYAGRHDEALRAAEQASALAQAGGAVELSAYVHWLEGEAREDAGDFAGAVESLERAAWTCTLLSCDALAVQAMAAILKIVASDLVDLDAAARWRERLEQAQATRAADDPALEATVHNSVGLLELERGRYDESVAAFGRAAASTRKLVAPELRLAGVLNNLGNALQAQGRSEAAAATLREAVALREGVLGLDHPSLVSALSNLGITELEADDVAAARAHFERAIAITSKAYGPQHPLLATLFNNLANVAYLRGEHAEARANYRRTLEVLEATLDPHHPNIGLTLGNLGLVTDEPAEALQLHKRALAVLEHGVPEGHPHRGMALNNIGSALRRLGRYDEAEAAYLRALAVREAALGPEHPLVATTVDNLGTTARLAGDPQAAIARHERSLQIWMDAHGPNHRRVAIARTGLADALLELTDLSQSQRRRARALARLAVEGSVSDESDPVDRAAAQLALARSLMRPPEADVVQARRLAGEVGRLLNATPGDWTRELATVAAIVAPSGVP